MKSELKLCIEKTCGRSVVTDSYATSPIKLGYPQNYTDPERLKVVIMMASAGLLKGDIHQYEIVCGQETKTYITDQAFTKIFDAGTGNVQKEVKIELKKNASLIFRPSTVMPFQNSSFQGKIQICLSEKSELLYTDMIAAGRIAMGERFAFREYRNRTEIKVEDSPVWIDHCLLHPEIIDCDGLTMFDGYSHQGVVYYYGKKEELLKTYVLSETNDAMLWKDVYCGVSDTVKGCCVRMLSDSAQKLEKIIQNIINLIFEYEHEV